MITFKQFITEEEQIDLVAFLKKNCLPACQDIAAAGKFLYRGMSDNSAVYKNYAVDGRIINGQIKTPRNNRAPRDTPAWAHKEIDNFFDKKFGIKLRSNSIFAYNNGAQAGGYGDLHIIIPFGKYDIYWADGVSDLTARLFPEMVGSVSGPVVGKVDYDENPYDARNALGYMLHQVDYQKGPNKEALQSGKAELMVVCERYIALDTNATKSSPNMLDIIDMVVE